MRTVSTIVDESGAELSAAHGCCGRFADVRASNTAFHVVQRDPVMI